MLPNINLLPKEKKQAKKKGNIGKIIIYILILAIIIFYAINYYLVNRDVKESEKKTSVLSTQIAALQKDIDKENNKPQAVLANSIEFANGEKMDLIKVIEAAEKTTGEFAGFSYKDDQVQLVIYFDSLNQASSYVKKLAANKLFKSAVLTSASAFTDVTIDNVDKEQDLEGTSRYKAIIAVTLDQQNLKSGGTK